MQITGRQREGFREILETALADRRLGDAKFSLPEQRTFIDKCILAMKGLTLEFGQIPTGFFDVAASVMRLAKEQDRPVGAIKRELLEDPSPLLELHRLKRPLPAVRAPDIKQPPAKKTEMEMEMETKREAAPPKKSGSLSAREIFEEVANHILTEGRVPRIILDMTPRALSLAFQRNTVAGLEPFCGEKKPQDFYDFLCLAGLARRNDSDLAIPERPTRIEDLLIRHGMPVPDGMLFRPQRS